MTGIKRKRATASVPEPPEAPETPETPAAAPARRTGPQGPYLFNLALLFGALFLAGAFATIHFAPGASPWKLPAAVAAGVTLVAKILDLFLDKKEVEGITRRWAEERLGTARATGWLVVLAGVCLLLHLSLSSLFLESGTEAGGARFEVAVERGGRQAGGAPVAISPGHAATAHRFWLPLFRRDVRLSIVAPPGYGELSRTLPFLLGASLKVPDDFACPDCLAVRLLPVGGLFQVLWETRDVEGWNCCYLSVRAGSRAPLRLDLIQSAVYLGAGELEIRRRLQAEQKTGARERFYHDLLERTGVPAEDQEPYRRGWERIRPVAAWALTEGEVLEIVVETADGRELLRRPETVLRRQPFQTILLEYEP